MKILLCHNFYQQSGGEEAAVLALKALLEEKGHDVIFFAEDNREIDNYGLLQKIGFFPRALFSLQTYRRLRQIAAREKPDIAHVHNVFPLISPALYVVLKQCGIPIVQTIHNYRLMCINGLFLREDRICELCKGGNFVPGIRFKCYRDSYTLSGLYALAIGGHRRLGTFRRIDRFIALSHFAAEKLAESGVAEVDKISVLGNFLPTPLPEYGDPKLQQPYVCYLGRLSQEKGIFTLLRAMRGISTLRLKVLGTGPLREQMHAYIHHHGLENVEMLGFVEGEEKYEILRHALCCVLPSIWYENFPFTVLESAAVGTPVVASRIGSLESIVSDQETGLLFAAGSSGDLRLKLEMLMSRPGLSMYLGKRARVWLEKEYTQEAHYNALMKVYQQLA